MLIIDNYDSFTYNIVEYLRILGQNPIVIKNDELTIAELKKINFSSLIISPGWGTPDNAGISNDAIKEFYTTKKILGICLGHQCICKFFGSNIVKAKTPVHGKTSYIYTDKTCPIFKGIKSPCKVTRYHSLIADKINEKELRITGRTADTKEIMAVQHKKYPIFGLQFHPESAASEYGLKMLKNFISYQ